jgi:hypothetical protein
MVVGRITDTSVTSDNTGIHISFGPKAEVTPVVNTPMLTQAEVQNMINASLHENNDTWQQNLKENKLKIDESIRKNLAANTRNSERVDALVQQVASASKDQIAAYVASLQTENMRMMQDYMKLTSNDQKDYMENLLVDFSKYLQQQRNDDLRLLQTKITDVEQNNNLFKAETEQILTSLISNSGASFQKAGIRN